MVGQFHNHGLNGEYKGYRLDDLPQEYFWIFPLRTTYRVTIAKEKPFCFEDYYLGKLTAGYVYESDLASIPPLVDRIWAPSAFRLSGVLHDYGCKHGGLWKINENGTHTFIKLTRKQMDELIERMAGAECALNKFGKVYTWITEHCIYAGVRIGAFFGIGKPAKKKPARPRFPTPLTT